MSSRSAVLACPSPRAPNSALGDFRSSAERAREAMLKSFKVVFPTVRDPEENVSYKYGTYKVPESYIIDRNGKVVRKFVGLPEQDGVAKQWTDPEIVGFVRSLL